MEDGEGEDEEKHDDADRPPSFPLRFPKLETLHLTWDGIRHHLDEGAKKAIRMVSLFNGKASDDVHASNLEGNGRCGPQRQTIQRVGFCGPREVLEEGLPILRMVLPPGVECEAIELPAPKEVRRSWFMDWARLSPGHE